MIPEIPDESIDTSEVPELGADFFENATLTAPGEALIKVRETLTNEQKKHIREFGVPTDTQYPSVFWIGSVDVETVMPTDGELRMIRSYIEFEVRSRYNESYQEAIFAKPFPAQGGHVTKIFKKGAKWLHQDNPLEGWRFRKGLTGGTYWPVWPEPRMPTLIALLDAMQTYDWDPGKPLSPEWVKWKAEHPEVFGPVSV